MSKGPKPPTSFPPPAIVIARCANEIPALREMIQNLEKDLERSEMVAREQRRDLQKLEQRLLQQQEDHAKAMRIWKGLPEPVCGEVCGKELAERALRLQARRDFEDITSRSRLSHRHLYEEAEPEEKTKKLAARPSSNSRSMTSTSRSSQG